jgi:hypothetical protein
MLDKPESTRPVPCIISYVGGSNGRNFFRGNTDRNRFLERLGAVLPAPAKPFYAWALIPKHFHPLLKTGLQPIATVMRRLLTGYAVTFNRRHHRYGRLFQNRYKRNWIRCCH